MLLLQGHDFPRARLTGLGDRGGAGRNLLRGIGARGRHGPGSIRRGSVMSGLG
ncbi:hypothetical protein D187_002924 [Cystobacter fuscus DSM 2262]|uniref:Uncharacterized protein n=1 Tax=Cystobacter fuscus (strain ATCC 25194 / DSM 2262 / NBRC 100088 / M29) TaxID=1242864 RepID=S9QDK6_CYSF2|nr:hypothetical protein D187_002924 [Cystobacter fuscus DSM 2262]